MKGLNHPNIGEERTGADMGGGLGKGGWDCVRDLATVVRSFLRGRGSLGLHFVFWRKGVMTG